MTSDGIKHASQKEATRWCELKLLERAGKISDLQRQVEFELIPCQYETYERFSKRGELLGEGLRVAERRCVYVADFVYTEDGKKVVEDTKGMRTKEYVIKRKLMLYIHHIRIKEV
jgi:hypothetical protein